MSQKSSLTQNTQSVPQALTSDTIAFSLHEVDTLLLGLQRDAGLSRARDIRQAINPVLEQVSLPGSPGGIEHRLNAHIDRLQISLNDLAGRITEAFFR
jgi:hypothetical protein